MGAEQLEPFLKLIESYGALLVFAVVSGFINIQLFIQLASGKLVPRRVLDDVESDRDRLQAILDKDREKFMEPMLDLLRRWKKEDEPGGGTKP